MEQSQTSTMLVSGCLPSSTNVKIRYCLKSKLEDDARLYEIISIGNLKTLFASDEHYVEIATPDGYKTITNWYDKGVMDTVTITTTNGLTTTCSISHLIETKTTDGSSYIWTQANELTVGATVLTENGDDQIATVAAHDPLECFDFEIDSDNHRYYGDGISSHNSTSNNKGNYESTI